MSWEEELRLYASFQLDVNSANLRENSALSLSTLMRTSHED
jgi:hypothetical protein